MAQLLEIKEKILRFYAKRETYIKMVLKFILALVIFLLIRGSIGYMVRLNSIPILIILALICCLLPINVTMCISAVVVLLHLYSLTMEAAVVGLILFLVVFFLYFRFCPKDNVVALLTVVFGRIGVPQISPVISGLIRPIYSVISVACGTIVFHYINGVHKNAPMLTSAAKTSSSEKMKVCVGLIADNKEMLVSLIAVVLTSLLVYLVRRMKNDYSWVIAFIAGALAHAIVTVLLSLILSVKINVTSLLIGTVLALLVGYVLMFFCMNLDYTRVENVQFEDDEYYYYVKAVPKRIVAATEKQVKQFGNTGKMPRSLQQGNSASAMPRAPKAPTGDTTVLDRKALAKELDIDEDLLK